MKVDKVNIAMEFSYEELDSQLNIRHIRKSFDHPTKVYNKEIDKLKNEKENGKSR